MRVFLDVLSNQELFSDAYSITEEDGVMYKVKSKWVVKAEDPEYEEQGGAQNPDSLTVNELEDKFGLIKTQFKKKEYVGMLKKYIGKIQKYLNEKNKLEELNKFRKGGLSFVKKITAEFSKWEFFFTPALENGMIVLQQYGEDQITPYLYYWKHGIIETKY